MTSLDPDSEDLASSTNTDDPSTKEFQGDLKVSNALPKKATLATAEDIPVLNKDGKKVPFKSLYAASDGECRRVLSIFIRHFFCGVGYCSLSQLRINTS